MDLHYSDAQIEFRREVRAWLEGNVPAAPLPSFDTEAGFEAHRQWERTLAEGNWGMVTWPEAYGGRGCDLIEWLIFEEEYYRAGAPLRVNQNGIFLLGPTLMEYGSEEQKARFIPAMARGDEIWAQGWSEPNAGSDMAAIRCRAIRDGDDFVINGQKIWSTRAVYADWVFGLFRTDPESERHHGLSKILVPLNAEGVTVRPIRQLNGLPGFAEIFFDDVRVPAFNLLGGEGIRHAMDSAAILGECLLTGRRRMEYRSALLQHFGWRWLVSNRLARRTWWGLDDQQADRRMARLIHGLSGQTSAEGLSNLLFHYRFERYGWRLLPYLL